MKKINPPEGNDVPVRSAHRAQAPKKPFCLEVGKTYEARRKGYFAKITGDDGDNLWPMAGKWVGRKPRQEYYGQVIGDGWGKDGCIWVRKSPWDLVREVKSPKGSAKRPARSRPKSSRNPGVTPKSPTPKPSRRAG